MVRLTITSCPNNNGKQTGRRILLLCTILLLLDNRNLSRWSLGQKHHHRSRRLDKNLNNPSFSLRNRRKRNYHPRRLKYTSMEI